jgi:hypothetical protein
MSQLQEATVKVKFYKGYVWNAMPYGDHEALCEEFGLKYTSMKEYGYVVGKFADDILERYPELSYTHFQVAARKREPDKILQLSSKEGWSSRELRRQLAETERLAKEGLLLEGIKRAVEEGVENGGSLPLLTDESVDEVDYVEAEVVECNSYEESSAVKELERISEEGVNSYDAASFFGFRGTQLSERTWSIICKHYVKDFYDVSGKSNPNWELYNVYKNWVEVNISIAPFKGRSEWFRTRDDLAIEVS